MIIRRVELQQATGIDVFSQIKELQQRTALISARLSDAEKERKDDIESLRSEFSSRMDGIQSKVDELLQDLQMLSLSFKTSQQDIEDLQKRT